MKQDAPTGRYRELLRVLEQARAVGVTWGLDRVTRVLTELGHPERHATVVQIAGTNGKGSTAAMTAGILRAAGLRTGLFTSPHLSRFTERIELDGREADGDALAALVPEILALGVPLSYFELATVLAHRAFAAADMEAVVLETGLGGRLDATTACAPVATAITSIAYDHTDELGPTLADIAGEKAGIAKPGVPLFLGALPAEAEARVVAVAATVGAPVAFFGRDFAPPAAAPALLGAHQLINAAVAVQLAGRASGARGRRLDEAAIASGLGTVRWPGRMEAVEDGVLLDCAHNAEGARALADALRQAGPRPRVLLVSIVAGKPAVEMLSMWAPLFDAVVVTQAASERALPAEQLAQLARQAASEAPAGSVTDAVAGSHDGAPGRVTGPVVHVEPDPWAALARARALVPRGGQVVVTGSIFLVGQLRARLRGEAVDPAPVFESFARSTGGRR